MKTWILTLMLLVSAPALAQECYDLSSRSQWISTVCYANGAMSITMQGSRYNFCNVPYDVFQGILRASSPGTYYENNIRGRYRCPGY